MTTATRWDIIEQIVKTYALGRYGLNDATASTSTVADDSQFGAHRGFEGFHDGDDIRFKQNAEADGSGADTYANSRISKRGSFSGGVITVDPLHGLGEVPDPANNVTEFLVSRQPFRFEDYDYALDKILGVGGAIPWERRIVPITLVADGDMRSTSATADWGTASNGTPTKVAATFPFGERAMNFEASGVGGYVLSSTIAVEPSKPYYLEVTGWLVTTASGDAGTLALYDETNSAAITVDDKDITRQEPAILRNNIAMPSTCTQVSIRLTSTGADDDLRWANLIFRKNEATEFVLPDTPTRILDIGEVRATSVDTWSRRDWKSMTPIRATPRQLDSGLWELHLRQPVAGLSVWYEEFAIPGTLSTDASTTNVPKELVAAVAAHELLKPYRDNKEWAGAYLSAAEDAARVMGRYATQRVIVEEGSPGIVLPAV